MLTLDSRSQCHSCGPPTNAFSQLALQLATCLGEYRYDVKFRFQQEKFISLTLVISFVTPPKSVAHFPTKPTLIETLINV
jgi:hypothetical protein